MGIYSNSRARAVLRNRVLGIVSSEGKSAFASRRRTAGTRASQDGGQSCAGTGRKRLAVLHDNEKR